MAVAVGIVVLNPLWAAYSPPFSIPRVFPAITAPVDGPFYLQNADDGYQWETKDPRSLWFHPLLSVMVHSLPSFFPSNVRFWLLSLVFAFGSLGLSYKISEIYNPRIHVSVFLLPFLLIVPGALSIGTGNAEIPALSFASALLVSVLVWQEWRLTFAFGICSILTKPNALYMLPILMVYFISGYREKDAKLWRNAIAAILSILLGWIMWMGVVDYETGQWGTYLQSRLLFDQYTAGNLPNYFVEIANSFIYSDDVRNRVRYATSLIIPLVNFLVMGVAPFARERDRYALAAGNAAMLALILLLGNPNKAIVYTTTLPGYFAAFLLVFHGITTEIRQGNKLRSIIIGIPCAVYCTSMLIVYVYGTPLGWYY